MNSDILAIAYLVSGVLFIFGLKGLTSPSTARRGNYLAIIGMVIAVAATLLSPEVTSFSYIWLAVLIGAAIGVVLALKIQMTAMLLIVPTKTQGSCCRRWMYNILTIINLYELEDLES